MVALPIKISRLPIKLSVATIGWSIEVLTLAPTYLKERVLVLPYQHTHCVWKKTVYLKVWIVSEATAGLSSSSAAIPARKFAVNLNTIKNGELRSVTQSMDRNMIHISSQKLVVVVS